MSHHITLPWPPLALHPNGRSHWLEKADATRKARFTAPQLAVLLALDTLAEGLWAEPKALRINRRVLENIMSHDDPRARRLVCEIYGGQGFAYRLTPTGRALVAQLRSENVA